MAYDLKGFKFDSTAFFTQKMKDCITEIRVDRPNIVQAEAMARRRRSTLTTNGKLCILATDHPARRVTGVGSEPFLMADRLGYLGRVLRVIAASDFDGVMGPTDIIEDLFIMNYLVRQAAALVPGQQGHHRLHEPRRPGRHRARDGRPDDLLHRGEHRLSGLDGAKIMFRLDVDNPDSLATIE